MATQEFEQTVADLDHEPEQRSCTLVTIWESQNTCVTLLCLRRYSMSPRIC